MNPLDVRPATNADHAAIRAVETAAFGQPLEAGLVDALRRDGDVVLELVATSGDALVGHVLFSRLIVEDNATPFAAVALAPLAVAPGRQRQGIGAALIAEAHARLRAAGERLSLVLGDYAYYGRFGYGHARAAGFDSAYQGEALQALAWGAAPLSGRLVYARAFAEL